MTPAQPTHEQGGPSVKLVWGWGVHSISLHGRSRMIIDPRIPTMPGRSTSGFHRPGRGVSCVVGGVAMVLHRGASLPMVSRLHGRRKGRKGGREAGMIGFCRVGIAPCSTIHICGAVNLVVSRVLKGSAVSERQTADHAVTEHRDIR